MTRNILWSFFLDEQKTYSYTWLAKKGILIKKIVKSNADVDLNMLFGGIGFESGNWKADLFFVYTAVVDRENTDSLVGYPNGEVSGNARYRALKYRTAFSPVSAQLRNRRKMKKANNPPAEYRSSGRNQSEKPKKRYEQIIFRDWCKSCGLCSAFCPKKVIDRSESGAPVIERYEDCIGCRFCEYHCPDFAITITERGS